MAAGSQTFELGPAPTLRGEVAGEGPPLVLCHGITATRKYVVHGSRSLERAGHRIVTYDARGHGESDPAPPGQGYGYPELVGDLERVVAAELGEAPFVLAGHSMGAHTAVAYALRHSDRLAGLAVIGPAYAGGEVSEQTLAYWDGLAAALEDVGVDGFVAYIEAHQGIDPAFRDSVLRFTRERISLHGDRRALAEALRELPRSRPFDSLDELAAIEVPALVVASYDEADPGHPYAVAEAYAEALPQARLLSEEPGQSPLAWQGGKLSRELAAFCAEPAVTERFKSSSGT
jgi:pimeloyl-ACP methyl ester carboxylesterase